LNKMVSEGWIEKIDSGKRGTSVMFSLTVKALRCHSLKIGFDGDNKYVIAYQYLLSQAALGSTHLVSLKEPQAGAAVVIDPRTNKLLGIVRTETVEGVSELDLLERKHHGNGGIFRHLIFTKDEVQEYFKLLVGSILKPITVTTTETRY